MYHTKSEAQRAKREKINEMDEQKRNPSHEMKIKVLMSRRLDELEINKSTDYYKENKRYFQKILDKWGNVYASQVTRAMVNDLLMKEARRLKKAGKSNHKVNSLLRSLKALYNYGNRVYDLNIKNPCNLGFYPIDIVLKTI